MKYHKNKIGHTNNISPWTLHALIAQVMIFPWHNKHEVH